MAPVEAFSVIRPEAFGGDLVGVRRETPEAVTAWSTPSRRTARKRGRARSIVGSRLEVPGDVDDDVRRPGRRSSDGERARSVRGERDDRVVRTRLTGTKLRGSSQEARRRREGLEVTGRVRLLTVTLRARAVRSPDPQTPVTEKRRASPARGGPRTSRPDRACRGSARRQGEEGRSGGDCAAPSPERRATASTTAVKAKPGRGSTSRFQSSRKKPGSGRARRLLVENQCHPITQPGMAGGVAVVRRRASLDGMRRPLLRLAFALLVSAASPPLPRLRPPTRPELGSSGVPTSGRLRRLHVRRDLWRAPVAGARRTASRPRGRSSSEVSRTEMDRLLGGVRRDPAGHVMPSFGASRGSSRSTRRRPLPPRGGFDDWVLAGRRRKISSG